MSVEYITSPINFHILNVNISNSGKPYVEVLERSKDHQSADSAANLSNLIPFSFYFLQPQNNLPIIGSYGNLPLAYYPTFGLYPLTPILLPLSTQFLPPASNFHTLIRTFAFLAPLVIPSIGLPAIPHIDSLSPKNAILPSFAIRQEEQDTRHIATTNSKSNKS